jgi:hypothetical protein
MTNEQLKNEIRKLEKVKKGDIFVNTWGYDQTNKDFWKVVRKTPKSAVLKKLKTQLTETGFMSGDAVPLKIFDPHYEKVIKRIRHDAEGKANLGFNHGWTEKWGGKPERASWYA